jgi:hypothetical protein
MAEPSEPIETHSDGSPARAPISRASELGRRPGRPYSEVAGHAVVVIPERRSFIELAPGSVALWAGLDGRPLADVVAELGPPGGPTIAMTEAIELARRWRALGLVEEGSVLAAAGAAALGPLDASDESSPRPPLSWRASSAESADAPDRDDALAWFGALLSWVSDQDLAEPGVADALAELAEEPDLCREVAARSGRAI